MNVKCECPKCGWTGTEDQLVDRYCPACMKKGE